MQSPRSAILGILVALVGTSCHECGRSPYGVGDYDDVPQCRFDPGCDGGMGALCDDDDDCESGFCCRDDGNCAGGMCTAPCDVDAHCPPEMLCEHHKCFFACDDDDECADGMSCEHDHTVCEWP
jgi:hypothetical protein